MSTHYEERTGDLVVSVVRDRYKDNEKAEILITKTEALTAEASMAMLLIERWGLVAAEIDGEDTSGRQKIRRLVPKELVDQACDTAKIAFESFRERGWVAKLPTLTEAKAIVARDEDAHPETSK